MKASDSNLIIFDFDGVVADSEIIANTVLAEIVTDLGVAITTDESIATFMGKRSADVIATIEKITGLPMSPAFGREYHARTLHRFRHELKEIAGVRAYLDVFAEVKRCIASSSSRDRLEFCLDHLNLGARFRPHVYSAQALERGKPHPDIFLHAACEMNVKPDDALVIEDSEHGVLAGVAAGMTVIGFLGGSHVRDGHADKLLAAGAWRIARNYDDAGVMTARWLSRA